MEVFELHLGSSSEDKDRKNIKEIIITKELPVDGQRYLMPLD